MGAASRVSLLIFACCLIAGPALGQVAHTYMYDQFDEDIIVAAGQISGISLAVQPGFAEGEAIGQLYRPDANHYPVKILGIDLFMASPNGTSLETNGWIEFWAFGDGPSPSGGAFIWAVHTQDLFDPNSGQTGIPLTGNVGWSVDFDWDTPDNHPPLIYNGNIGLVIRYDEPAQDLFAEWGVAQCMVIPGLTCGCQPVAPIMDQVSTSQANLMHILASGCAPPATVWNWANSFGVNGDFILRMRAEVGGGCAADCVNKDCGDDGCGGSCGDCVAPEVCDMTQHCVCVPDCAGRCCGDDGCGGVCPDACGAGWTCNAGSCTCIPDAGCTDGETRCSGDVAEECVAGAWQTLADCAASNQVCVNGACEDPCQPDCTDVCCGDDGCGNQCPDNCQAGYTCNPNGCTCDPDASCTDGEVRCLGEVVEDCLGGAWQAGVDCAAGGQECVDGACQDPCQPDCTGVCCGDDGCGNQCPDSCDVGYTCDPNDCLCDPDPNCTDGQSRCVGDLIQTCVAGAWQDGVDCAAGGQVCVQGTCQDVCEPDCVGKVCGDDGCGSTCGSCQAGEDCVNGACVPTGGGLAVDAISPDFGYDDGETSVSVTGEGFVAGATVRLGGTTLSAIQFNSAELLSATVPADMEPGLYMLIVTNPDGDTDSLADAFEVRHRESTDGGADGGVDDPGKSSGCGCGHAGGTGGAGLFLLLLGALIRRRR